MCTLSSCECLVQQTSKVSHFKERATVPDDALHTDETWTWAEKKRTTKCLIVLIKPVGYVSEKTLDLANGDDLFGWIHKENTQQQAKKEKKKEKKKCPRWELQPKPFAYQEVFAKALMLQKCQLWPGWKTRFKLKFDQKRIFFWISLLRLPPRFCTAN